MSGPYRVERRSNLYYSYIVVGPTGDVDCYREETYAVFMATSCNAAYAAGQAGGGDRIAALEKALDDMLRMLIAVRYTVGLGKRQMERIEKARSLLPPQTSTRDGGKESV